MGQRVSIGLLQDKKARCDVQNSLLANCIHGLKKIYSRHSLKSIAQKMLDQREDIKLHISFPEKFLHGQMCAFVFMFVCVCLCAFNMTSQFLYLKALICSFCSGEIFQVKLFDCV